MVESTLEPPDVRVNVEARVDAAARRPPYGLCLVIGLGGLFVGVTGSLLSTFVPLLVRDTLGTARTAIGAVMAIDNVLLLLLVPWAGAASDRAVARGRGRLPLVIAGFALTAAGMAVFPWAPGFGLGGVVAAMIALYSGINLLRSPFQALIADVVPSHARSFATGSVTFQMCVGAIVFLMLGRILGMRPAFLIAAGAVVAIAIVFASLLREPATPGTQAAEATVRALVDAVVAVARGALPGVRQVFVATLLLQMTFQSFTTWFALHGVERFGLRAEDVTIGFIAWALGGVIGALPAGVIGTRFGRRNAMLAGFALMAASMLALHMAPSLRASVPLIALASAFWTLPMVNAYPLFVEPIPPARRGVLAAVFLLSMALGGAIGDPLNGFLFDLADSYRPLFVLMAVYSLLALGSVLGVARGR